MSLTRNGEKHYKGGIMYVCLFYVATVCNIKNELIRLFSGTDAKAQIATQPIIKASILFVHTHIHSNKSR